MTAETRAALPFLLAAALGLLLSWSPALLHWASWVRGPGLWLTACGLAVGLGKGLAANHAAQGREWERQLENLYRTENRHARVGRTKGGKHGH